MPGMATEAQMTRLESLHGTALDILFLQLMIHHHQGGVMMADYAREHATEPYVIRLAGAMYTLQSQEISQMKTSAARSRRHPAAPAEHVTRRRRPAIRPTDRAARRC